MPKNRIASLFFFFTSVILMSCLSSENSGKGSMNIVKVNPMELQSPRYGVEDTIAKTVATGANDFAFRLSSMLAENVGNDNLVCSPYSVWLPLAALINATNTQNKDGLLTALGTAGITEADVNRVASQTLYNLTNVLAKERGYYNDPLKIVNAIFVSNDVTIKMNFAQIFMDYYRGSSINIDFSSPDAVNAVNLWASENTDGLITNLVQGFDPLTVAVVVNAIYFSDRWSREFDPEETEEQIFYAHSGETTAFYMLYESNSQNYYEDDRVQAMPLSFSSGGGMYIILPKTENAVEFLSSMSNSYFEEMQTNSFRAIGKLLLPRFSIENNIKGLKETLEMLGIPLFDKDSAPLTGRLIEEDIPLYLSDVVQKTAINVDERGTTATAVTSLGAYAFFARPQPTESFEMICNKPFVFILFDHIYDVGDQILFTGVVNKPQ